MSSIVAETEVEIWNRTVDPENGNLVPEAARALLEMKLSPSDVERVNDLSARAQEGALTEIEMRELDNYLNVGRALEFLKAKARISLQGTSPTA